MTTPIKHMTNPGAGRRKVLAVALSAFAAGGAWAQAVAPSALPTGGQITAGQAAISQSGNAMTVQQGSAKAIINWQQFNIGNQASVQFIQPSSSAIALNRVVGSDASAIYGALSANGQVFLVNPNGVLFARGARVDVGGLTASTLDIGNEDFLAGNYRFVRGSATAGVTNQGELNADYVALLAPEVRNEGVIAVRQGTAVLAAGDAVTLSLTGNDLVDVQVDKASIDTLVENAHLIRAPDGTVLLSAQSANDLMSRTINSGVIEATGLTQDGGTVRLVASSEVRNTGRIDVSAGDHGNGGKAILFADLGNPDSITHAGGTIAARGGAQSGNGGFIETSGSHVKIAPDAPFDTRAAHGTNGTWLIDPQDFTVAASGGDITGTDLAAALDFGDVTITTDASTASCTGAACGAGSAGNGDIIIDDDVSWTGFGNLTLEAWRHIRINANLENPMFGGPVQINYAMNGLGGMAYVMAGKNASAIVFDNVHSVTTSLLGQDTTNDFIIGVSNIPLYARLPDGGTSVYGDSLDQKLIYSFSVGGAPVNLNMSEVGGTATYTDAKPNVGSHSLGIVAYTGGLSGTPYGTIGAGDMGAWNVTQRAITITANTQNKDYGDALVLSNTAFTVTSGSLASGDTITSATITSASGFDASTTQAAGTYAGEITLSAPVGTGGFGASNYAITTANGALVIDPRPITLTADDRNKTFGTSLTLGTTAFSLTAGTMANSEVVDNVVLGSANGYASSTTQAAGSYAAEITGSGATGSSGFLASNYDITYAAGMLTIDPAMLTVIMGSLTGTVTKVYDGSLTIGGLANANFSLSGWAPGDGSDVTVTKTSGTLDNANVGTGKTVTVDLVAGDFTATTTNLSNYTLPTSVSGAIGDVTQRPITVTANAQSKTYGTVLNLGNSAFTRSGSMAPGQNVTSVTLTSANGYAASTTQNAGSYASEIVPSAATGSGGFLASNYNITYLPGTLTIDPALLTITGSLTGSVSKVYDGTTTITGLTNANFNLSGWANGDGADVTVTKTTGTLDNKNVGTGKTVTVVLDTSDFTATSTNLANYILPTSVQGDIAKVTPANLLVLPVNGVPTVTKVYDGTTAISNTQALLVTLVGEDLVPVVPAVSVTPTNGVLRNPSVRFGTTATFTIDPAIFSGIDLSNYSVGLGINFKAIVTPASLTYVADVVSAVTGALPTSFTGTVTGFVNNETLASATTGDLAFSTAATSGSAAGSYAINGDGLTANRGNYTFVQAAGNATALTLKTPVPAAVVPNTLTTTMQTVTCDACTVMPPTYTPTNTQIYDQRVPDYQPVQPQVVVISDVDALLRYLRTGSPDVPTGTASDQAGATRTGDGRIDYLLMMARMNPSSAHAAIKRELMWRIEAIFLNAQGYSSDRPGPDGTYQRYVVSMNPQLVMKWIDAKLKAL